MTDSEWFLSLLILLGMWFQTRAWRQWRRDENNGVLRFVQIFCGWVEAIAVYTLLSSHSTPKSATIAASVVIAVILSGIAYRLSLVDTKKS